MYEEYTTDELWLIKESGFHKALQNIRESQFTLGNGYFASRGILEEIPYDSQAGTYIAGIYDKFEAKVADMVNLPNPFNFSFSTKGGEKLDVVAMDVLSHQRVLNLKKALLVRTTVYRDSQKRRYRYESLRFISWADKNLGFLQIALTPLDADASFSISTGLDTSVYNAGGISEGRKRHFRIRELGQVPEAGFLVVETLEKKYTVVYWSGFHYQNVSQKTFAPDNILKLKLKKGKTTVFTKVFLLQHFPSSAYKEKHKSELFRRFRKYLYASPKKLIERHISASEELWSKVDIVVEGTANLQQNLRFNLYHLLISRPQEGGFSSVGARGMSGEGYRGHIFWDAEIFILPFYLYNLPPVAADMLLYRFRRLEAARRLAQSAGYKGVMFPWESADSGEEETPAWAKDIDGSITKIYTHKYEHHITADIAYAIFRYYEATEDREFMEKFGYEMAFEIARFWASRGEFERGGRQFSIKHVIGPDEFHIDVNNNAYTNMMARWSLIFASRVYKELKKNRKLFAALKHKLNLSENEVKEWKHKLGLLKMKVRKDIIEQFDGYFRLKDISLRRFDENGLPILPSAARTEDINKTRLVKQADVLMFLYLFSDYFSQKTLQKNYEFYIKRTVHKSSLSPAIHSILASWAGDMHRAYTLFNVALRTDISNLYGNTAEGIHLASCGGVYQALIFGFCGLRIRKGRLSILPRLPYTWRGVKFSFFWQNCRLHWEVTHSQIQLQISSKKRKNLDITVLGKSLKLRVGKLYTFRGKKTFRKESWY